MNQSGPSRYPASPNMRRRRLRYGALAELFAAIALFAKGYRILARRYAANGGEIDLIAMRHDVVCFVEVKARHSFDAALLAIDPAKQQRFSRAVGHWRTRNPWANIYTLRCDAVLVVPGRWPRHIPDAFQLAE
jgi:putative endonuclease